MVERSSRFVMLLALPDNRRAETVRDVIARKIQKLPADLVRSLTWDQGKEMGQHAQFTVDTGVAVYFCDPHSPWQRGTVENTNRLLRQYFPRGADYSPLSQADLDLVADELNQRPPQNPRIPNTSRSPQRSHQYNHPLTGRTLTRNDFGTPR